jgi:hypothetical protein
VTPRQLDRAGTLADSTGHLCGSTGCHRRPSDRHSGHAAHARITSQSCAALRCAQFSPLPLTALLRRLLAVAVELRAERRRTEVALPWRRQYVPQRHTPEKCIWS